MLRGSQGDVSGFKNITTCRGGRKNSRDNSAAGPFMSGKSATSVTRHEEVGDVADKSKETSRVCRGRHGEVSIVEFWL